jgi:hypothetical protein
MRAWKLLCVKHYTATLLVFLVGILAQAQPKFYTRVSEGTVAYRKTFQVQYIIEGATKIQDFHISPFTNFTIEDEFEIPVTPTINAETLELVDTYSKIFVLSPHKTGVLTIPGATARIDGKLMRSNPLKIVVRQSSLSSMADPDEIEDESEIRPGETIEEKIRENFFLTGESNKKTCYIGEPIMVTYKACSRLNANSQVVKRPSLTGFSVIEMVDNYDNQPQIERINGKAFYTHLIRKAQLFPLQAGTFQLDGAEVESTIYFMRNTDTATNDDLQRLLERSTIDQLPVFTRVEHKTTLKSKPFSISVKALPATGQPGSFSGAVGQFSIALRVLKNDLQQGEPGKLQVMISGNGNFPLVTAPVIEWPKGIEVSEPTVKEELNKFIYPLQGGKIFEYPFSSKDTGTFIIPSVEFSYFDPALKKYVSKKSSGSTFRIVKGNKLKAFIKRSLPVKFDQPTPIYKYWLIIVGTAITGIVIYLVWGRVRLLKNTEQTTSIDEVKTQAENIFDDPFSLARQAMYSGDKIKFFSETQRVLWKTVAAKCNVNPSALNKQNITAQLRACNIPENTITELQYILNECEWAVYTPSTDEKNMNKLLASAQKVRTQLQDYNENT